LDPDPLVSGADPDPHQMSRIPNTDWTSAGSNHYMRSKLQYKYSRNSKKGIQKFNEKCALIFVVIIFPVFEVEEALNQLILQLGGKVVDTAGRVITRRNKKIGR
jgi:hypothetical protein